jgi:serine protease Do
MGSKTGLVFRVAVLKLVVVSLVSSSFFSFADSNNPRETAEVRAIRSARKSVVLINTVSEAPEGEELVLPFGYFAPKGPRNGMGSGAIVDKRGYVLTNNHVIEGTKEIKVTVEGVKTPFDAKIVATMAEGDLALLKIEAPNDLPAIAVGQSSDLELGETLIALGHPLGFKHMVATKGILSALAEEVEIGPGTTIPKLLQTDAAINPGNSGGVVINLAGEMVGVVVAMARAQGIGFALPVDEVRVNLAAMVRKTYDDKLPGFAAKAHVVGDKSQLYVESITEQAECAGLRYGDRILMVNGRPVFDEAEYELAILGSLPGQALNVQVGRGNSEESIAITIQKTAAE